MANITSQWGVGAWGEIPFGGVDSQAPSGITPEPGGLTFTGLAPNLEQEITIPVGVLTFTGFAPALEDELIVPPGALVFQGFPPDVPADSKSHFPVALNAAGIRTVILPDPNRTKHPKTA